MINNQFLRIDSKDGYRYALLCDHCIEGVSVTFWAVAAVGVDDKLIGVTVIDKPFHVVCDEVHDDMVNNLASVYRYPERMAA